MIQDQIVLLLSPILVGVAGWLVVLAAKYLPGHPHLDATQLTALFALGVTYAATHLGLYLHSRHRSRLAAAQRALARSQAASERVPS